MCPLTRVSSILTPTVQGLIVPTGHYLPFHAGIRNSQSPSVPPFNVSAPSFAATLCKLDASFKDETSVTHPSDQHGHTTPPPMLCPLRSQQIPSCSPTLSQTPRKVRDPTPTRQVLRPNLPSIHSPTYHQRKSTDVDVSEPLSRNH